METSKAQEGPPLVKGICLLQSKRQMKSAFTLHILNSLNKFPYHIVMQEEVEL